MHLITMGSNSCLSVLVGYVEQCLPQSKASLQQMSSCI